MTGACRAPSSGPRRFTARVRRFQGPGSLGRSPRACAKPFIRTEARAVTAGHLPEQVLRLGLLSPKCFRVDPHSSPEAFPVRGPTKWYRLAARTLVRSVTGP